MQVPAADLGIQKLSFLASLSKGAALSYSHPEAVKYTNFAKTKSALARKLYGIYNKNVFGGNLPVNMSIDTELLLGGGSRELSHQVDQGKNIEANLAVSMVSVRLKNMLVKFTLPYRSIVT